MKRWIFGCLCGAALLSMAGGEERFSFAILGDRTGEAQPGVYEQVWREAAAEGPAFVLSVGDSIQGGEDSAAGEGWRAVRRIWVTLRRLPLCVAPGNRDGWSAVSGELFRKY